jgi:hypothetical protein
VRSLPRLRESVARASRTVPGLGQLVDAHFVRRLARDLRRFNDVLASEGLVDVVWLTEGVLLGLAREGRLLRHDRDADFGILREDLPRLLDAASALSSRGFKRHHRYYANDGRLAIVMFIRRRTFFEFVVFDREGDDLRYVAFDTNPDDLREFEGRVPDQPLVPVEFLGRRWMRHADPDRELTALYGDWRIPQTQWVWQRDELALYAQRAWLRPDVEWRDGEAVALELG